MNILFFGDVVGKPGREAVKAAIPALKQQHHIDVVIANVENMAHGFGITPETITELQNAGVDLFTSGNHIWKNSKGVEFLQSDPAHVLRPANYAADMPGLGWTKLTVNGMPLLLINVQGQVFMKDEAASPFGTFDDIVSREGEGAAVVVDLHAEATGEKMAFGWYVDGRASLVVGTHTHVPTADEKILPGGTAYITDLGMCGATDSSLGMNKELVLQKVAHGMDISLEPPTQPTEVVASGVLVQIDNAKKAVSIVRIDHRTQLTYTKNN